MKRFFLTVVSVLTFLFSSCVTAPEMDSFPLEKGVLLHFIHPFSWIGETGMVLMDLSIQESSESFGSPSDVVANFTWIPRRFTKTPHLTDVDITSGDRVVSLSDIEVLYVDRIQGKFRYSSKLNTDDAELWFCSSFIDNRLKLYVDNAEIVLMPGDNYIQQMTLVKTQFCTEE